jgi:UDP-N-acetylmuramate--alanine ligase
MLDAAALGLRVEDRVTFLTDIFNASKMRVAVVGSAGKTTTAALLCYILVACGKDPSYAIGGMIGKGANGRWGRSGLFVAEADESDGSVTRYQADLVLFTNMFPEHRTLDELRCAFGTMFGKMPDEGVILYSEIDEQLALTSQRQLLPVVDLLALRSAGASLEVQWDHRTFKLPLAGAHNFLNVELAVAAANRLGIEPQESLRSLELFPGVEHRMVRVGETGGILVYSDFAHSPNEIRASYESSLALNHRVVYAYQPHGFKPTYMQRDTLAEVFGSMRPSDTLVLTDIYYGGGTVKRDITGDEFYNLVRTRHSNTHFVPHIADLPQVLAEVACDGSVVILAGARTIFDYGEATLAALERRSSENNKQPG